MDKMQRGKLLEHVLATLNLLKRIQCPKCYEQLGQHFEVLADFICCRCGAKQQPARVRQILLRYQHALDTFGCCSSLKMSTELHSFSDEIRNLKWTAEISSPKNVLCVLLHLVLCRMTGTEWICKKLQNRWLAELQEAVVHDEEVLSDLWGCAAIALQVKPQALVSVWCRSE